MRALLKAFWDIALLRRDPGHLPDSPGLVVACAAAYAALSAAQSWMLTGADRLFARTALDLALLVALVWLLLAATRRSSRLNQTLSAVLGTGALLSPFVIVLLALRGAAEAQHALALLVWAGSVLVILWYTFILGHIIRSALDTGWFTGVAIAITYVVASAALLTRVFPEAG